MKRTNETKHAVCFGILKWLVTPLDLKQTSWRNK